MKIIIYRVRRASVSCGEEVREIGPGICVLLGIREDDFTADADYIVAKILNTRLFDDENKRAWGVSVLSAGLQLLIVSQFTLYGFLKGNKPDFHYAMKNAPSKRMYDYVVARLREAMPGKVEEGFFGMEMLVDIQNDGPCTLVVESREEVRPEDRAQEMAKIGGPKAVKLAEKEKDKWLE